MAQTQSSGALRRSELWSFVRSRIDPGEDDLDDDDHGDGAGRSHVAEDGYGYFGNGDELDIDIDGDLPNSADVPGLHRDYSRRPEGVRDVVTSPINSSVSSKRYHGVGKFFIADIPALIASMDPSETESFADFHTEATSVLKELLTLYPEASFFRLYKVVDPEESAATVKNVVEVVTQTCWGPSSTSKIRDTISLSMKLSLLLQASKAQNDTVSLALHDALRAMVKFESHESLKSSSYMLAELCENMLDQITDVILDRAERRQSVKGEQVQETLGLLFELMFVDNGPVWLGNWTLMLRICEKYFRYLPLKTISTLLTTESGVLANASLSIHYHEIVTKVIAPVLNDSRSSYRSIGWQAIRILFTRFPVLDYSNFAINILPFALDSLLAKRDDATIAEALKILEDIAVKSNDDVRKLYIKFLVQCILNTRSSAVESILMLAELLSEKASKGVAVVTAGDFTLSPKYSEFAAVALLRLFFRCATEAFGQGALLMFKYLVRLPTFSTAPINGRKIILFYLLQMRANHDFTIELPCPPSFRLKLDPKTSQNIIFEEDVSAALNFAALQNLINDSNESDRAVYPNFVIASSLLCFRKGPSRDSLSVDSASQPSFGRLQPSRIQQATVLPIAQYCAAIMVTLSREEDIEIMLLILKLLHRQLRSLHYFRSTGPQLTVIRSYLCTLVANDKLLGRLAEKLPMNLRGGATSVVSYAITTLLYLLMYKHLFSKKDTEEILLSFQAAFQKQHHIGKQALHSLFLAMFEFPQGMIKVIPGTLLKISQIFTASMAIPILEFLTSLGKRKSLCVNFTDDDFRKVFMVAINYIQSPTTRSSPVSVAYVTNMAFQVLSTFFLRLKLHERKSMMHFIVQYLLKVAPPSKEGKLEENMELVLDFLCSNVFFETEASVGKVDIPKVDKLALSKYWVYGNTILHVSISKFDPSVANVIIRRPSGVFTFSLKIESVGLSPTQLSKIIGHILRNHRTTTDIGRYQDQGSLTTAAGSPPALKRFVSDAVIDLNGDTIRDAEGFSVGRRMDVSSASQLPYLGGLHRVKRSESVRDDLHVRTEDTNLGGTLQYFDSQPSVHMGSSTEFDISGYEKFPDDRVSKLAGRVVRGRSASLSSAGSSSGFNGLAGSQAHSLSSLVEGVVGSKPNSQPQSRQPSATAIQQRLDRGQDLAISTTPATIHGANMISGDLMLSSAAKSPASALALEVDAPWKTLPIDISLDPNFVISQFFSYSLGGKSLLPSDTFIVESPDAAFIRSVNVLDRTPTADLHKIGLIYVGMGQSTEAEILSNQRGSLLYTSFLKNVGSFISLKDCTSIYVGGLDTSLDLDGKYGVYLQEDSAQLIFHVTTLMPTNPNDPLATAKKRHIGNDFVNIIWNESGNPYTSSLISAQFNYVNIVIEPISWDVATQGYTAFGDGYVASESDFDNMIFRVLAILDNNFVPEVGVLQNPILCSGTALPSLISTCATLYNTYAQIFQTSKEGREYTSATTERCRLISKIRSKLEASNEGL